MAPLFFVAAEEAAADEDTCYDDAPHPIPPVLPLLVDRLVIGRPAVLGAAAIGDDAVAGTGAPAIIVVIVIIVSSSSSS